MNDCEMKATSPNEENEETNENTKPQSKWMNRRFLLVLNFLLIDTVQFLYFSYKFPIATTLEKRFAFSSKVTGVIVIATNISGIFASPVAGHMSKHFNRARLIAYGLIFEAVSCFIQVIPFFIYDPVLPIESTNTLTGATSSSSHLCSSSFNQTDTKQCDDGKQDSLTVWPAVYMFSVANLLSGLGLSAFYALGLPTIDDNVSKKNASIYFTSMSVLRDLIGPASGALLASYCLSLPEQFFRSDIQHLSPNDPRFIGAWWLGYLIIALLLIIALIPLLFLTQVEDKVNKDDQAPPEEKGQSELTRAKKSFYRLITNPIWVFDHLAAVFRYLGMGGFFAFLPKYLETQFRKTASDASLWSGAFQTIFVLLGMTAGGAFVRIVRPKSRALTVFILIVELLANLTIIWGLLLGCERSQYFAIDNNLIDTCNQQCNCLTSQIDIHCSADGQTHYLSPCFAGCDSIYGNNTPGHCACEASLSSTLTKGLCESNCDNFYSYMAVLGIGALIAALADTGNLIVRLRSMENRDKTFACGLSLSIMATFAWSPFPIIFGAITDAACSVWQESECGERGNCWLYDDDKFKLYLHASAFAFMMMGSFFDTLLVFYSGRLKNLYGEDEANSSSIKQTNQVQSLEMSSTVQ